MPYDIYYPGGCTEEIGDHYCSNCPELEGARVRAVALIKKGFEFLDPSDPTEWQTGVANKDIIIISGVNGSFDGGSEVEVPGYGDQATFLAGYNFVLTYNDPNYKNNADFYNAIKRSSEYKFAYKTETQIHIVEKAVSLVPKNPVGEDITGFVVWNVLVKWADKDLPIPYNSPEGVFTCFDYVN